MDPIDITYNDEVGFLDDKKRDWQDWIMKLLLLAKKEIGKDNNLEMSINFVDEDRSHEINLKYRDKDRPTDVISFAIEDGEDSIDLAAFEDDPDFQEPGAWNGCTVLYQPGHEANEQQDLWKYSAFLTE